MSLQKGYLTQYEDVYDLPGRVYDTSKAVRRMIGGGGCLCHFRRGL